jgi:hypothetical protein
MAVEILRRCAALWVFLGIAGGAVWAAETKLSPPAEVIIIKHSPQNPRAGDVVTISAKLPAPAANVGVEYAIVEPGDYISITDPRYKSSWISVAAQKKGPEQIYEAEIPASVQTHRRLIRYRLKLTQPDGKVISQPPADDPEPNYAYFVYNGVPAWKGAIQPHGGDGDRGKPVEFGTNVMTQVQSYFLLGRKKEIENTTWYQPSYEKEYKYTGSFVFDGVVYDHIRFRARGGVWRFAMGKNMWKIEFNKGHRFAAKDDYGRRYKSKWSKLNLRSCIQQGDYGRRGEQGMYEAVGFRLFNLAGVDAPKTHWVGLRIVDEKEETPADQYKGDFWGLYLAIENEDGRFLDEHELPDGNLYKMMGGQGELSNHGMNQVTNRSDIQRFFSGLYRNSQPESWWRKNVDLPRYYSYRAIVEAIHHYDIGDGKNYDLYLNPKTEQWCVIPWDIDLTWGDHMYGNPHGEPFFRGVLSKPALKLEYQNRVREIRDLLYNTDETYRLIDECASIISFGRGKPSFVDADRAKWDYHPIMASRYSMSSKAGQGLFYQASKTGDFAGMVAQMKEYVKRRAAYLDSLANDPAIPQPPTVTHQGQGYGPKDLVFKCSAYSGSAPFAGVSWRAGEIDPAGKPGDRRSEPGHYEITPVWESGELGEWKEQMSIPFDKLKSGHSYRVRARMKDATGRWSHWSPPVEFKAP